MNPQTESHTDVQETDCYGKAIANGEAVFCLRAQDGTAYLAVRFWIKAQIKVQEFMAAGLTLEKAVKAVEEYYYLKPIHTQSDKQADALTIAEHMEQFSNRKLAD